MFWISTPLTLRACQWVKTTFKVRAIAAVFQPSWMEKSSESCCWTPRFGGVLKACHETFICGLAVVANKWFLTTGYYNCGCCWGMDKGWGGVPEIPCPENSIFLPRELNIAWVSICSLAWNHLIINDVPKPIFHLFQGQWAFFLGVFTMSFTMCVCVSF